LLQHRCLVYRALTVAKVLDEWVFERGAERRLVKITNPVVITNERVRLINLIADGARVTRLGCFDPTLVTSGRLRRVLEDWSCPIIYSIYAMYRKTPRLAPKIAAFLDFAAEACAAFDPQELTIIHQPHPMEFTRRHRIRPRR
jgi:DNA-binding transcriptional LysR family regulator